MVRCGARMFVQPEPRRSRPRQRAPARGRVSTGRLGRSSRSKRQPGLRSRDGRRRCGRSGDRGAADHDHAGLAAARVLARSQDAAGPTRDRVAPRPALHARATSAAARSSQRAASLLVRRRAPALVVDVAAAPQRADGRRRVRRLFQLAGRSGRSAGAVRVDCGRAAHRAHRHAAQAQRRPGARGPARREAAGARYALSNRVQGAAADRRRCAAARRSRARQFHDSRPAHCASALAFAASAARARAAVFAPEHAGRAPRAESARARDARARRPRRQLVRGHVRA